MCGRHNADLNRVHFQRAVPQRYLYSRPSFPFAAYKGACDANYIEEDLWTDTRRPSSIYAVGG